MSDRPTIPGDKCDYWVGASVDSQLSASGGPAFSVRSGGLWGNAGAPCGRQFPIGLSSAVLASTEDARPEHLLH